VASAEGTPTLKSDKKKGWTTVAKGHGSASTGHEDRSVVRMVFGGGGLGLAQTGAVEWLRPLTMWVDSEHPAIGAVEWPHRR
jgi:hypothetical protein